MLTLVEPAEAVKAWAGISAIGASTGLDPADVAQRLTVPTLRAWRASGEAQGWVLTSVCRVPEHSGRVMFIYLAAGKAGGRGVMREIAKTLEDAALGEGCVEIRAEIERLAFLKVLPGWEQCGTAPSGKYAVRKEL